MRQKANTLGHSRSHSPEETLTESNFKQRPPNTYNQPKGKNQTQQNLREKKKTKETKRDNVLPSQQQSLFQKSAQESEEKKDHDNQEDIRQKQELSHVTNQDSSASVTQDGKKEGQK